ncbi:MAG: [protein-PII] uridylyltransferase [Mycobacteriales bacterium]
MTRSDRAALLERGDLTGQAFCTAYTAVADAWLVALFEAVPSASDVALVAVGGLGRGELCPGSDLDLVLLHRGGGKVGAVADALWYPIWDSGISLDHSVRTVREALQVANDDLKAALGLLDARHVAGDASLTAELVSAWRLQWRKTATKRLPELFESSRARHDRAGELAFLLEPDLKESRGGLRDLHSISQAAAAWVVEPPGQRARAAYDVLLSARVELHRATGRGTDILRLQDQDAVATALGYADADALMRAVSEAARIVGWDADRAAYRVQSWVAAATRRKGQPAAWRPAGRGVVVQDGEVRLGRDGDAADPAQALRVASAAAVELLPISTATLDALVAAAVDVPEPWPADMRDELVTLLAAGPGSIAAFEALDHHGLLERLLPEWATVRSKPQRNAYHRFTVDRHLCEAAANAAARVRDVARPDLLVVGAWLHDIGKGFPGDHTEVGIGIVDAIGTRMGFPPADVETLVAMVRHHLLLADTAMRRDLDDPLTIEVTAKAVGNLETLQLLAALTEADSLATGPAAWSEWKAGLVGELVRRTAAVLGGVPAERSAEAMTPRERELVAAGEIAVERSGSTITVVAPDRPGLLSRVAGALALHRLDVRAASIRSVDGMAVEVLDVTTGMGDVADWDRVAGDVRRALSGRLALESRLAERAKVYAPTRSASSTAPPRVVVHNDASDSSTVLEVRASDGIGVLYRITRALAECELDVRHAKVSTLGHEVVDSFYVVDSSGQKIDDAEHLTEIERAILAAVTPGEN